MKEHAAPAPIALDAGHARAFMRAATAFGGALADVPAALDRLGFVQMDPINVCGRMHDLVLRNRVRDYRENDLLRHSYGGGGTLRAFEHYLPGFGILVTFPLEAWPFLLPHMRERASDRRGYYGKLPKDERALARHILGEIERRGPLGSDQIEHAARGVSGWGSNGRLVKLVMEKLLAHGELLIAARRDFRRVYDLPARALPQALLAQSAASPAESRRWVLLQRLKQRRLARIGRADLALVDDCVQALAVPDCSPLYCLREDLPLLDATGAPPAPGVHLLAPLDPLIYDRTLTARLWGFDYTWEVYTPPAKRVRGYYALPLLAGLEIVGHVDPRADRAAGRLEVMGRQVRRGHRHAGAVKELAVFLGLRA